MVAGDVGEAGELPVAEVALVVIGAAGLLAVVTVKAFTARPTPPCQGSKPAWMLVRNQELWAKPRCTASLKKVATGNLAELAALVRT